MTSSTSKWPEGLAIYYPFGQERSEELYQTIGSFEWNRSLSRPTQHYGYQYSYSIREPKTQVLSKAPSPPPILQKMAEDWYQSGKLQDYPNQIIVNKYRPGEGIAAHRDHYPIFGYDVATLSLGSEYQMEFKPHRFYRKELGNTSLKVFLPVGSLLVFGGDARYKYTHEIRKRKTELVGGKRVPRGTRISVTFRHVNPEYRG